MSEQPLINDRLQAKESPYLLRPESVPQQFRDFLAAGTHTFRGITKDEVLSGLPDRLTREGWGGIRLTAVQDDMAHRHMGSRMLLAIENATGTEQAYVRWEFGYIPFADSRRVITPAALSHMTSVDSKARDGGIGTIMKYFLFQAAHEASGGAVDVFTWTYDPMQGRNARVNLGHLGAICGFAGGLFEEDAYGSNTGAKQHSGNPTDRFHVVYNRTSAWAQAHFNGHVLHPSTEEVKKFAKTNQITFETPEANSAMPGEVNLRATDKFIVMPIPYDWDKLLVVDGQNGFKQATAWRSALREVFGHYFNHGWTAVDLIPNKSEHQNYILLCRDFDPNHPPAELLK